MTTVLDCIERIPKCLKGIRDSYPKHAENIADYLSQEGIGKAGRLVFIASGSSYNSAHTAKLVYQALEMIKAAGKEWYQAHKNLWLRRNKMMMAGTGDLYPIVNEGDIKVMEMFPMITR